MRDLQVVEIYWERILTAFKPCITLMAYNQRMLRNILNHLTKSLNLVRFWCKEKIGLLSDNKNIGDNGHNKGVCEIGEKLFR